MANTSRMAGCARAAVAIALALAALPDRPAMAQIAQPYSGQLAAGPTAAGCATDLPPFGASLFNGVYLPHGTMTVVNTGAACAMDVTFFYGQPSSLVLEQAPQHGQVTFAKIRQGASFRYQPAPGYTGADGFEVRTSVGGRNWTIPVAINVTR